jgi:acyl-CoA synthetase (AMP-forming)/AMP-acid ligase II
MIYTSGTTGKPKGALRSATRDPAVTAALVALIGYQSDDVYLTTGPLYHSGPGGFAVLAQALGNTIIVQRKFDATDWLRLVDAYRVSTTFSAPTPIRMVCSLPDDVKAGFDRASMRRMIANAAPWAFSLKQRYVADFPADSLWEVYGSTELGVDTILAPADQLRKPGSCGLPAPGVEIKLFDEDGSEITEPGVRGELYVRSANVFDTYYKAHDKYDRDRRGEFHTVGDVAYRDEEGYYYIADRKNDMIISGGMNVYPAEIEAALEQHPGIYDVAVFGIPSEEWGEQVHAVVVRTPSHVDLSDRDVVEFARQHLAGYKIPRSVTFTNEIPRTGSGKILKRELRAPYWANR